jgi:hypothetical protein
MFCFLAVVGAWSSDRKRGYAPRGFHWLVLSEDLADGFLSCRRILFDDRDGSGIFPQDRFPTSEF